MSMVTLSGSIILDSYLLNSITWRLPLHTSIKYLALEYFVIQGEYQHCFEVGCVRSCKAEGMVYAALVPSCVCYKK